MAGKAGAVLLCLALLAPDRAIADELRAETRLAFDRYFENTKRAFVARPGIGDARISAAPDGLISAGPAKDDGVIEVPGGLVHHWKGTAFISGVTLAQAIEASQSYSRYPTIYKAVIASKVLEQKDDRYDVQMRILGGTGGVHVAIELKSIIEWARSGDRAAYSIGRASEIREVKDPGTPKERLLPAGQGNGYLWDAATLTRFVERDGGVWIEMETLGLSREFPPMLGWIAGPIVRKLGRRSVERSLREFVAGVRALPSTP